MPARPKEAHLPNDGAFKEVWTRFQFNAISNVHGLFVLLCVVRFNRGQQITRKGEWDLIGLHEK